MKLTPQYIQEVMDTHITPYCSKLDRAIICLVQLEPSTELPGKFDAMTTIVTNTEHKGDIIKVCNFALEAAQNI